MHRTGTVFVSALIALTATLGFAAAAAGADERVAVTTEVHRIPPAGKTGHAFRLTYTVNVPVEQFWKFKTDFGGEFLLSNRYIISSRLVSRRGNVYITETRYVDSPDTVFKWQTTIYPSAHRMNYRLLNPKECGQNFNRGTIQLSTDSGTTRVEHSTYFDFFGATIWAHFPGPGGMVGFLRYTAEWERETIERLKHRYLP